MCTQIPHLLVFCELQSSSRSLVTRSFITELCTIESELSPFDCPLCKYKHSSQPLASLTQWNTVNFTFSVMDNNHRSQENPVLARSVIQNFRSTNPGISTNSAAFLSCAQNLSILWNACTVKIYWDKTWPFNVD